MIQLLGHQGVERQFSQAMQKGCLHHAWLLHGMKGIGKHVLAERLAARLMCEHRSACGECHSCRMLAAGSHPDVYRVGLIEGKRDLNIDQVREVLAFLALSGAESARRVIILDDAERMNGQAANALLKGLEEPSPGNLLLIVCADVMRLPATVRSRCLLQHCATLCDADVREVLKNLPVSERYLNLAVKLADGAPGAVACMRDDTIAEALEAWGLLVGNVAQADIGGIEAWLQKHVKDVPHALIVRVILQSVYPVLQQPCAEEGFAIREKIHASSLACSRWPGEVLRQSLRAAPSLLAYLLQLRSALREMRASPEYS